VLEGLHDFGRKASTRSVSGAARERGLALLFFLHGARLSREAILAGIANVRLHALVLASTSLARGNVAAAVRAASLSVVVRIFVTPLLAKRCAGRRDAQLDLS
jgi:predicted Na+-dependent transporter